MRATPANSRSKPHSPDPDVVEVRVAAPPVHRTVIALDDVDRQLVELLQANGRASNRALADEIGISEVTVASRISRLITNGAVRVTAMFDWRAAGYEWFANAHIRCDKRDPRQVAASIAKIPGAYGCLIVFGDVDIIASFVLADRAALHRLVTVELPSVTGVRDVKVEVATETYAFMWRTGIFPLKATPKLVFPAPIVPLDDLDHALIAALIEDGRQSNRAIGRELGVSEGAIRLRFRRLTESGLMRVLAVVDPVALGTIGSAAFCSVNVDGPIVDEVATKIAALPECWLLSRTIGRSDLSMTLMCSTRQHLADTLMRKIRTISGVKETSTSEVIEVVHHLYHWARFD